MAFVKKVGSKYGVFQGNNGRRLNTFSSRGAAMKEVARLHRKNKPKTTNRGASARRKATRR